MKIDRFEVLDYLLKNPDFLIENANKLGVNFDSKKIRSLAEAQIIANKNKIDKISNQYKDILDNIHKNEIILNNLEKLYFDLMGCNDLLQIITAIEYSLTKDFLLPIFAIKFVVNNQDIDTINDKYILDINTKNFNDLKKLVKPFCDSCCISESLYYCLPTQQVESFLYIPLNYKDNFLGIILIAHQDYQYFTKDLAIDFINSMAKAISITLYRILY